MKKNPSYKELSALPAEAYLDPENFVTPFDEGTRRAPTKALNRAREQYERGLDEGRKGDIHISNQSVWSSNRHDGSMVQSYEGIGYHAHTASLLAGFLDSGGKVFVHRQGKGATQIAGPRTAKKNPRKYGTKRLKKKLASRFKVFHADHGISKSQMGFIERKLEDVAPQGFFIKQINLPKRLGSVPNAMYGPVAGDPPVSEKDVHYLDRAGRGWEDRMVDWPPRASQHVQVIGIRDGANFTLFTAYGGPLAPQHADDPTNHDPEASRQFWSQHALSSQQWAKKNSSYFDRQLHEYSDAELLDRINGVVLGERGRSFNHHELLEEQQRRRSSPPLYDDDYNHDDEDQLQEEEIQRWLRTKKGWSSSDAKRWDSPAKAKRAAKAKQNGPTRGKPHYPFAEKEEQYSKYTTSHLYHAMNDAMAASRAQQGWNEAGSCWYLDDYHTIIKEIQRRKAKKNGRRKDHARVFAWTMDLWEQDKIRSSDDAFEAEGVAPSMNSAERAMRRVIKETFLFPRPNVRFTVREGTFIETSPEEGIFESWIVDINDWKGVVRGFAMIHERLPLQLWTEESALANGRKAKSNGKTRENGLRGNQLRLAGREGEAVTLCPERDHEGDRLLEVKPVTITKLSAYAFSRESVRDPWHTVDWKVCPSCMRKKR